MENDGSWWNIMRHYGTLYMMEKHGRMTTAATCCRGRKRDWKVVGLMWWTPSFSVSPRFLLDFATFWSMGCFSPNLWVSLGIRWMTSQIIVRTKERSKTKLKSFQPLESRVFGHQKKQGLTTGKKGIDHQEWRFNQQKVASVATKGGQVKHKLCRFEKQWYICRHIL